MTTLPEKWESRETRSERVIVAQEIRPRLPAMCLGCGDLIAISSGKLVHDGNGSSYCDPDASLDDDQEES